MELLRGYSLVVITTVSFVSHLTLYSFSTLLNDIAVVRVKERIQCSDKVTPVNMPGPDFDVEFGGECEKRYVSPKSK